MNWITNIKNKIKPKIDSLFKKKSLDIPDDFWSTCRYCAKMMYKEQLIQNYYCCPNCQKPAWIPPRERFKQLFDSSIFEEIKFQIKTSHDPLRWKDLQEYKTKVEKAKKAYKHECALHTAVGEINKIKSLVVVFNSQFLGGSFGLPEQEWFSQSVDYAIQNRLPFICYSAGGGMRVTTGTAAVLGMPVIVQGFKELRDAKIPSINMFTNPTAGGITCCVFMADFSFCEDESNLIIFSGRKTIESVIGEKLDADFGTGGFLLKKGFIDDIVPRHKQKEMLSNLLSILLHVNQNQVDSTDAQQQDPIHTQSAISA
jgi:acetyl-CoA carboxylase carboxyl transferase subunit beta